MATVAKRTHTWRLLKLANILAKFRPTRGRVFDMHQWGSHPVSNHKPGVKDNWCGTSACALGHAAMDSGFRRAGLGMRWKQAYVCAPWQAVITLRGESPNRPYDCYLIGAEFFGLTESEAYDVFMGTHRTKTQVIQCLKSLAAVRDELRW